MDNMKLRYLGQAILYALFFLPLVYLTSAPDYRQLPPDMAELKIAIRHAGQVVGECTDLSSEDFANLAANMKRPQVCPRERSPLQLQLIVDGETLYRATVPASGLHNDGMSSMYQRFAVPSGNHQLRLQMNDDVNIEGPTWSLEQDVELAPAQVMVASFKDGLRLQ
jgi:hypothetical protein